MCEFSHISIMFRKLIFIQGCVKMRIISGKYKGRVLKGFDIDGTRPTMDRVKESLFAMIQNEIKESRCLDLFAGSGNLGIEALSNGAKECYFVDHNKIAIQTIKENLRVLNVQEETKVFQMDYKAALLFFQKQGIQFDFIFLDPPYNLYLINPILKLLKEYHLIKENGLIICEYEKEAVDTEEFNLIKTRKYGSKYIKIYQK